MQEKTILITGASSGIGRSAALLFAENDWNVAAVGRRETELGTLRDEVQKKSGTLEIHTDTFSFTLFYVFCNFSKSRRI